MTFKNRNTVTRSVRCEGIGVHSGIPSSLTIAPGANGLRFLVGDVVIPATSAHASSQGGATTLSTQGASVSTVEHLLASLLALGITDADLIVSGTELPIMDGSALGWCGSIESVGRVEIGPLTPFVGSRVVEVTDGHGGVATYTPSEVTSVEAIVDFSAMSGPVGSALYTFGKDDFIDSVAWARTFVMASDVAGLLASGRGQGANLDNTIVWTESGPKRPIRRENEVATHKLLDAIGDLALLGRPFRGTVRVVRGSHRLHLALVKALLAC